MTTNNRTAAFALIAFSMLGLLPADCLGIGASSKTSWTMPYERSFWKYAGLDYGVSEFHPSCQFSNPRCDGDAHTAGVFVGGKFRDHLGLEFAYFSLGEIQTAGGGTADGKTVAHGLSVSLTGDYPLAQHADLTGRVGEVFGRSNVAGNGPGLITATRSGWEPSFGAGVRLGIAAHWALRVDADRYRLRFSDGERGRVYALTAGLQYEF